MNKLISTGEIVASKIELRYLLMKLPLSKAHITDLVDVLSDEVNPLEYMKSKLLSANESFYTNSTSKPDITNIKAEQSAEVFKINVNNDTNSDKICLKCNKPGHIQKYCPHSSSSDRSSYRSRCRGRFSSRNHSYNCYFRRGRGKSYRSYGNRNAEAFVIQLMKALKVRSLLVKFLKRSNGFSIVVQRTILFAKRSIFRIMLC